MTTELTNHDSKCAFGKSQRVLYLRWPGFVRDLSLARSLSHSLNAMFAPTIFFQFDEDKYLFCTTDKFIVNKFRCLARYHWAIFRALCLCAFC